MFPLLIQQHSQPLTGRKRAVNAVLEAAGLGVLVPVDCGALNIEHGPPGTNMSGEVK